MSVTPTLGSLSGRSLETVPSCQVSILRSSLGIILALMNVPLSLSLRQLGVPMQGCRRPAPPVINPAVNQPLGRVAAIDWLSVLALCSLASLGFRVAQAGSLLCFHHKVEFFHFSLLVLTLSPCFILSRLSQKNTVFNTNPPEGFLAVVLICIILYSICLPLFTFRRLRLHPDNPCYNLKTSALCVLLFPAVYL